MSKKINRDLLQRAVSLLQARKVRHPGGSIESYKIHYTQIILEKMFQSDDCWLSICPFNYHNGNSNLFEEKLISLQHWNLEILDATFLIAIKFLQEAELTTRRQSRNSIFDDNTYETIWDWFRSLKNDDISPDEISQLNYIQSDYSLMLLNDYLGNKSFQAFLNYEENIKKIEQHSIVLKETSDNIQKSADEKLEKVEQLSDTLKNLEQGFNFVALSDGFSRMLNEKKESKESILQLLFLIAVIISAIPAYKFLSDGGANLTWQQIAISAGLELVLIYFFRVVLFHYRTVQTQIMQLDLRLSLCQFIQSYAEYAKEIKTNDKDALDKFENLIFSSILSSDEKIPSTFDGLEQLNSLIKQFKQ
jgi:hypothetical protein